MLKLSSVAVSLVLLAGCATNSSVSDLQAQIDSLKVSVAQVSLDAKDANISALNAATKVSAAEKAANRAAESAKATSFKLDSMFTKAMYK